DVGGWPVIARIGADPDAWTEAVAMAESLGATAFSVTVPRGTLRVEFAAVGVWGAMNAGTERLIEALRCAFAPPGSESQRVRESVMLGSRTLRLFDSS